DLCAHVSKSSLTGVSLATPESFPRTREPLLQKTGVPAFAGMTRQVRIDDYPAPLISRYAAKEGARARRDFGEAHRLVEKRHFRQAIFDQGFAGRLVRHHQCV